MNQEGTVERRLPKKFFTSKEDEIIIEMAKLKTPELWKEVAAVLYPRTPRQCRERYKHYLEKKSNNKWTNEEDNILIDEYNNLGPKWTIISQKLPNHTPINIKNRFALIVRRNDRINEKKKKGLVLAKIEESKENAEVQRTVETTDSYVENSDTESLFDLFDNYVEESVNPSE